MALALAVGLGFSIGEIWFVANQHATMPEVAALPFYKFWAFGLERIATGLYHGAMIAYLFHRVRLGLSAWPGLLFALVFHALLNLPIHLRALDLFELGSPVPGILIQTTLVVAILFSLWLINRLSVGRLFRFRSRSF